MSNEAVKVQIYDSTFYIRCVEKEEKEYLHSVAAYVDAQMREVAEESGITNTASVAVLAALNIADELLKNTDNIKARKLGLEVDEMKRRAAKLHELLERALQNGSEVAIDHQPKESDEKTKKR